LRGLPRPSSRADHATTLIVYFFRFSIAHISQILLLCRFFCCSLQFSDALAIFPPVVLFEIVSRKDALTMLFPFLPLALVSVAVRPIEGAIAVLLILKVLSFVAFAIGPDKCAEAVHFVVGPPARVCAPIAPFIRALPLDVILHEQPAILVSVCPGELTEALLHALSIVALEVATVRPTLDPTAILRIVKPEASVE